MPKALDPQATFPYILKADRDLPDGHPYKTVFFLRGLTLKEDAKLGDSLFGGRMGTSEISVNQGSQVVDILNAGLTGWENFNDVDDDSAPDWADWTKREVPFERKRGHGAGIQDGLLDKLSSESRSELADAITSRGKVGKKEGN